VAALTLTESERRFLRALLRRKVPFIVVGLSAAALQGAPVVTQDVDLWFKDLHDPRLTKALREVGAAYVPPSILNPPMFAGAGTELFDIVLRMDGLGKFSDELRQCIEVRLGAYRLKVLSLERILASKRAANRSKDKLTIPVLEDSLLAASNSTQAKRKPRKMSRNRRS
jgi:predicted nucleotidyltransferase